MARWITLKESALPFDYKWPDRAAITAFTLVRDRHGKADLEHFLKDEVADYIVEKGLGHEGKRKNSTARSRKGRTSKAKAATTATDAPAPDTRPDAGVADANLAAADRASDRSGVDPAAG